MCSAAMAMDVTLGLEGGLVFASATSQLDSDSGSNEWNSENWGALLYHYKGVCVYVFAWWRVLSILVAVWKETFLKGCY